MDFTACPTPGGNQRGEHSGPLLLSSRFMDPFAAETHAHSHTVGFPMMRVPLVCLLICCLLFDGMHSLDAYWEQEVREEDLLSDLHGSKVGVPLRMAALRTLCGRLPWLEQQAQEAWPRSEGIRPSVRWLYLLEQPCRRLYPRETAKEDLAGSNHRDEKNVPKRKSPYIQQRQFRVNTARRPYILKRSGTD